MHKFLTILAAALLVVPATAVAQQNDAGKAALKEMTPKWQAAANANDAAAVAALYAKDGVLQPPNSAPVEGQEAIQKFWAANFVEGNTVELTTDEMYGMGDSAAETGMWVVTAADGSHVDHGHYSLIYKQVNGTWKIASDMWKSDMSPKP